MSDNRNFTALDWVTGEINETLMQARQALEVYISNTGDAAQIRFCLTYLHQVHGILQMVEFHGGALLAEELEQLATALMDGKVASVHDAHEILMRAILQLPVYLEHIKTTRHDDPASLLPLLNDLRAVRGGALLTETALFSPDMSAAREIHTVRPRIADEKFLDLAKKLRKLYQATLVSILKDKEVDANLPRLEKVFGGLEKLCRGTRYQPLWEVALALVEGLGNDTISAGLAISNLLRDIEKVVKLLSTQGKVALDHFESEELLKNLLYYVAGSRGNTPRISAVRALFRLDEALPKTAPAEAGDGVAGVDPEAMRSVTESLRDQLDKIRLVLESYSQGQEANNEKLRKSLSLFRHASDTLAVLGQGDLRKKLDRISEELTRFVGEKLSVEQSVYQGMLAQVMDIVTALESQASGAGVSGVYGRGIAMLATHGTVLFECQNKLEQVKDAIVEYIASHWDRRHISALPDLLAGIRNDLETVGQRRSARILGACARYLKEKLLETKHTPDFREMDTLADAIAGVEYYLETLDEDVAEDDDSVLSVAEESVANLGYAVLRKMDAPAAAGKEIKSPTPPAAAASASVATAAKAQTPVAEDRGELIVDDFGGEFDPEIAEIFIEEMQEVLASIHEFYPLWRDSEFKNSAAMKEFRRGFHTMKGSGRMAKAKSIGELAWAVEGMLNRIIDGTIQPSAIGCELIERMLAKVPAMLEAFKHQQPDPDQRLSRRYRLIGEALSKGEKPLPFELATIVPVAVEPAGVTMAPVVVPAVDVTAEEPPDWDLWEIFVAEAEGHLEAIDNWIMDAVSRSPLPTDPTDPLQRALHTLKGSAYMAGVKVVGDLATPLEKFVKALRAFRIQVGDEFTHLLTECVIEIRQGLDQIRTRKPAELPDVTALLQRINALRLHLTGESEEDIAAELAGVRKVAPVIEGAKADPTRWNDFLVIEIDILLDADMLLDAWQSGEDRDSPSHLRDALEKMSAAAEPARLMPVASLAHLLSQAYGKALTSGPAARDTFLPLARQSHEALINFVDELAGGQDIAVRADLEGQLSAFIESVPKTVAESVDEAPVSARAEPAAGAILANPADFDMELLGIFVDEASELLEELESIIGNWHDQPANKSFADALKRNLHTYKGGARMAGLDVLGTLAHDLESRLEVLRGDADPALFDQIYDYQNRLFKGTDRARQLLSGAAVSFDDLAIGAEIAAEPRAVVAAAPVPVPEPAREPAPEFVAPPVAIVEEVPAHVKPVAVAEPAKEILEYSSDIEPELLGIFIEEASELLEQLDASLGDWQADPAAQHNHIDALKRTLHTLKGGARMAGMTGLGSVAHDLETYLETYRGEADAALFDMLRGYQDRIILGVDQALALRAGKIPGAEAVPVIQPVAEAPAAPAVVETAVPEPEQDAVDGRPAAIVLPFRAAQAPRGLDTEADRRAMAAQLAQETAQQQETVKIAAELVDELVNLAGETSISRGRVEQQVLDFALTLTDVEATIKRMQDLLRRMEIETEAQVQSKIEEFQLRKDDFDPLEMDRYSTLQQLTRSLMETSSDLIDLRTQLTNKSRETEMILLQQSRINTELQEGLMRSRMVPFSRMVPRLRRIVRQISGELKKEVNFDLVNVEGEMDRTVLERMVAPLEHMLRNALDHGIEMPAAREQAGKPRQGQIVLGFGREGGDVVITLKDDGGGIAVDKVRRKAIERGLMAEDTHLTDQEILQFIMQAGFSTAEKVTQLSGRGVGMDVVHSEIKQLSGSVAINSKQGKGTEFVVRLPFTVSVNRALLVRIGEDLFAVPLNSIEGIVRVSHADLRKFYGNRDERFEYAGTKYRIRYLGEMLNTRLRPSLEGSALPEPVILVRGADHAMALHVDQLLGSREIVVKSLGPQFAGVPGLSGATILGDGSVLVILDLMALVRSTIVNESRNLRFLQMEQQKADLAPKKDTLTVMVVDDSVTVRKVTSRLLEREGFEVMLAKDGADAMLQLQDHVPDVMLLDIEMPRMDGFEVATSVKNTERLKGIPIIMITSRTGEKHRERAKSIGVERYMGKPFVEEELLLNINELVAEKIHRSAAAGE